MSMQMGNVGKVWIFNTFVSLEKLGSLCLCSSVAALPGQLCVCSPSAISPFLLMDDLQTPVFAFPWGT